MPYRTPVVDLVTRVSELDRATEDENGESYVEFWKVVFNAQTVNLPFGTPLDAKNATDGTHSIPAYGATILSPSGATLYVVNKQSQVEPNSPHICHVYVTYGPGDSIELSITPVPYTQNVISDYDGNRIYNSAGKPYPKDFPLELDDEDIVAVIRSTASPTDYSSLANCVNSASVTFAAQGLTKTCAAGTLKMRPAAPSASFNVGSWAQYTTRYAWRYRADGWRYVVPDSGNQVVIRNNTGGVLTYPDGSAIVVAPLDAYGRPINGQPFLLDGNGGQLAVGTNLSVLGPNSDLTWGTHGAADATGVKLYKSSSMNAMLVALGIGS